MRLITIGVLAAVLSACGNAPEKRTVTATAKSVADRLRGGDLTMCSDRSVQRAVVESLVGTDVLSRYGKAGKTLPAFSSVTAAGFNRDIHEISCAGDLEVGNLDAKNLAFRIRPDLSDASRFVTLADVDQDFAAAVKTELSADASSKADGSDEADNMAQMKNADLEKLSADLTAECRGMGAGKDAGVSNANGSCGRAEKIDALLFGRGVCFGEVGQSEAEYRYHRCGKNSLQMQAAAAAGSDEDKCNRGDHDACMRL